jgi:hypothetical protein
MIDESKYYSEIDHDKKSKLKALIEGGLSWDDRFVHTIARVVSHNLQDEAFMWLVDCMLESKSTMDIEKYKYLFFNIGYYSDGFSEKFLTFVLDAIRDPYFPSEIMGAIIDGIFRTHYYGREDVVFQRLNELCQILISGKFSKKRPPIPLNVNVHYMVRSLQQRSLIFDKYARNEILIPSSLINAMFSGTTNVSKRFISMFFGKNSEQRLKNTMLNIWSERGPWDFHNPIKIVHHSEGISSSFYEYWMTFEIEWKLINTIYYASRVSISSELPIPNEDEWCICPALDD